MDIFKAFSNPFDFKSRSSRSEFWPCHIICVFTVSLCQVIHPVLGILSVILLIVPWLSVQVRRLHDLNRSGLWLLLGIILTPIGLILLIYCLFPGTKGSNHYGPNPLDGDFVHSPSSDFKAQKDFEDDDIKAKIDQDKF